MLGLREKVGRNVCGIARVVGDDAHLRRARGHIDGNIMQAHLLLCRHDILVTRPEYLIDFRHALRPIGHGSDGLHASNLEYLVNAGNLCSHQNGRVHPAVTIGWRAKHNLLAACNLCGSGQHQHR